MKTIEYTTIDKSTWGPGPWQEEPDKIQYVDEATGLPCLIVRNGPTIGALCGYVGVLPGHPLHGKRDTQYTMESMKQHIEYFGKLAKQDPMRELLEDADVNETLGAVLVPDPNYDERLHELRVHGGVTFTGKCQEGREKEGVCHTVEPGEEKDVMWIGFDCCHFDDFSPGIEAHMKALHGPSVSYEGSTYKTIGFVRKEIRSLAEQLANMAPTKLLNE